MKPASLLLRVYGEKSEGQWSLVNLEFSLAAQADSLEEAKAILESQIKEYLHDALVGEDRPYAAELLRRPAPAKYWIKYWMSNAGRAIFSTSRSKEKAYLEAMPMVPAC